jgi:hypothetical protein
MKPHKHAELIKAWADGATIEHSHKNWEGWVTINHPTWDDEIEYRIKPEPKSDFVTYYSIDTDGVWWRTYQTDNMKPNIAITFDGETGEPKSSEMLK